MTAFDSMLSSARQAIEKSTIGGWEDFGEAAKEHEKILREIASTKGYLRSLVLAVKHQPDLLSMCEQDEFRYKLVLFRNDERDFRLRLHMWRTGFTDCAHGHRFDYTALLLNGGYTHTLYDCHGQDLYPTELSDIPEKHFSVNDPQISKYVDVNKINASFLCDVDAGQCYSQHHSLLSSTVTKPDTVSLFIRGPAKRPSSVQWDVEKDTLIWRRGVKDVEQDQRERVRFTLTDFDNVVAGLERLNLI